MNAPLHTGFGNASAQSALTWNIAVNEKQLDMALLMDRVADPYMTRAVLQGKERRWRLQRGLSALSRSFR